MCLMSAVEPELLRVEKIHIRWDLYLTVAASVPFHAGWRERSDTGIDRREVIFILGPR